MVKQHSKLATNVIHVCDSNASYKTQYIKVYFAGKVGGLRSIDVIKTACDITADKMEEASQQDEFHT